MLDLILKILIPGYFEYQEEMEKEMKTLEKEVLNNER